MSTTQVKKSHIPWIVIIFLVGFVTGVVVLALLNRSRPASIIITPASPLATPQAAPTLGPIRVYITGAVKIPAVYELARDTILLDAVTAAGGLTSEADESAINLALPLRDGLHIHIPLPGQEPIVEFEGDEGSSSNNPSNALININYATIEELDTLPGIGLSTAQKIIDYRQANGAFASIEEIERVSGIGPAKLDQIRGLITVD